MLDAGSVCIDCYGFGIALVISSFPPKYAAGPVARMLLLFSFPFFFFNPLIINSHGISEFTVKSSHFDFYSLHYDIVNAGLQ